MLRQAKSLLTTAQRNAASLRIAGCKYSGLWKVLQNRMMSVRNCNRNNNTTDNGKKMSSYMNRMLSAPVSAPAAVFTVAICDSSCCLSDLSGLPLQDLSQWAAYGKTTLCTPQKVIATSPAPKATCNCHWQLQQCALPVAMALMQLDQRICLTRLRCLPDSSDTQLAAGPAEAELLVHKLVQRLLQ